MWNSVLNINSVLLTITFTFVVYSIGTSIITWSAGYTLPAIILFLLLVLTEVIFSLFS